MRLLTLRSYTYSLLIHLVVAGLLVFSFSSAPRPVIKPVAAENIIEATTIDNKEVEKELERLQAEEKRKQEQEQRKQKELEKKLKDLERQQRDAVNKRKQEERRIAELKKQKEAEERQLKEKEKQRLEEEKRKREEEERKKKAEEALKKQLAEEQAAEQERRDQSLLQKIIADIYRKVTGNFNKTGLPKGLECVLSVQTIPGGEVISVTVNKSSGNEIFDRRAVTAVEKASPLPLPDDPATFDRLNLRRFNFRFKPED